MRKLKKYLLLLLLPLCFFSCEREFVFMSGSEGLNFSVDTLMFDTIFTSVGSVTKNFRVYNPYDEDLIISAVELSGGELSSFRLNINGQAQERVENLKINAKDSLFVFVDITINPDENENKPFVVNDSIIFHSGEKSQKINLVAYGQNVKLLKKANIKTTTFTAERPYLIYDFLVVDSLETLTIEKGTRLHFHNDARLIVFGSMQVNGTAEEPVSFLGDRLDDWYADKPGQWGNIHFMPGSSDNIIDHAIIKNGLMGIFVDSVGLETAPPLKISNTEINHVSQFGILTQNSKIDVTNTVIGDCGYHSVALTLGGTYNFYHCTLANYFPSWMIRNTPALFLNNYFTDDTGKEVINPLIEASFYNSIIYGDRYKEIGFDFKKSDKFVNQGVHYKFVNCLLKSGDLDISDENKYVSVWANENPNFIDPSKFNYHLDTLSFCKDIGNIEIANLYPEDILNNNRLDDDGPDLGAYERIEME